MKVVAIIQARMGSTRLPGKVLRVLEGATVLEHVIRRVQRASNVDEVVVATTESPADQAIAEASLRLGVSVFRGSEDDVLSRYYVAAKRASADVVVRVTSDCPLVDSNVLRAMVARFLERYRDAVAVDYLSNTLERTFPRGLDVEVFTFTALECANHEATSPAEREHVTPYMYRHPERFRVEQYSSPSDCSHYRLTLDTEDDWKLLKEIFRRFSGEQMEMSRVIDLLNAEPGLSALNAHVQQKALGH